MTSYYKKEDVFNAFQYLGNNHDAIEEFVRTQKCDHEYNVYNSRTSDDIAITREGEHVFGIVLSMGDWVYFDGIGHMCKRTSEEMSECSVVAEKN